MIAVSKTLYFLYFNCCKVDLDLTLGKKQNKSNKQLPSSNIHC